MTGGAGRRLPVGGKKLGRRRGREEGGGRKENGRAAAAAVGCAAAAALTWADDGQPGQEGGGEALPATGAGGDVQRARGPSAPWAATPGPRGQGARGGVSHLRGQEGESAPATPAAFRVEAAGRDRLRA
ncbi:hypothetical protein P7K49_029110 [Saguinus oedipus]|uniref:Uncharacterized protein n=1 Tax=Saguinus oedipus TaxID=9490 RepID=A0ABQ9U687_SAGOE|nr:hypothetical protein P7K49_029110 [Saguinus oedipus]